MSRLFQQCTALGIVRTVTQPAISHVHVRIETGSSNYPTHPIDGSEKLVCVIIFTPSRHTVSAEGADTIPGSQVRAVLCRAHDLSLGFTYPATHGSP